MNQKSINSDNNSSLISSQRKVVLKVTVLLWRGARQAEAGRTSSPFLCFSLCLLFSFVFPSVRCQPLATSLISRAPIRGPGEHSA
ncbi:unnamed protein product [Brassica rapa subsp. trilocularis]